MKVALYDRKCRFVKFDEVKVPPYFRGKMWAIGKDGREAEYLVTGVVCDTLIATEEALMIDRGKIRGWMAETYSKDLYFDRFSDDLAGGNHATQEECDAFLERMLDEAIAKGILADDSSLATYDVRPLNTYVRDNTEAWMRSRLGDRQPLPGSTLAMERS